mmetsp:Transcript_38780/g.124483  ORF Transcript_38780/g.124483 Transcript_38780/m.124483 type:complete len:291 (+) Transcript_38780:43-915(+)
MSEVLFKFKSDIEYSSHSLGALSEISVADLKQAITAAKGVPAAFGLVLTNATTSEVYADAAAVPSGARLLLRRVPRSLASGGGANYAASSAASASAASACAPAPVASKASTAPPPPPPPAAACSSASTTSLSTPRRMPAAMPPPAPGGGAAVQAPLYSRAASEKAASRERSLSERMSPPAPLALGESSSPSARISTLPVLLSCSAARNMRHTSYVSSLCASCAKETISSAAPLGRLLAASAPRSEASKLERRRREYSATSNAPRASCSCSAGSTRACHSLTRRSSSRSSA